jgi:DNA-binding NtrC family response regulator
MQIVLVSQNTEVEERVRRAVEDLGQRLHAVCSLDGVAERLEKQAADLVLIALADAALAAQTVRDVKGITPSAQVAVLADWNAAASSESVPAALAAGARTVLPLPVDGRALADFIGRVSRTVARRRAEEARVAAKDREFGFARLVGASPAYLAAVEEARRVAASSSTACLLLGETGTGKDFFARAIHQESGRRGGPFIEVNCAAIPPELVESELFGHERGAFTDAHRAQMGLCELADGGTLFLDEIGELPLSLQPKLLRFLDAKTFRRVAGVVDIAVDIRIIAATNRDLAALVRTGEFRADLFYRLNVVNITLPPLRERGQDIQLLADAFLARCQWANGNGRSPLTLTQEARATLEAYPWPGNVRELQHVLERAALLCHGETLDVADLRLDRDVSPPGSVIVHAAPDGSLAGCVPAKGIPLHAIERCVIEAALEATGGNVVRAARLLSIGRGALRSRLRRLNIHPSRMAHNPQPSGRELSGRNRAA